MIRNTLAVGAAFLVFYAQPCWANADSTVLSDGHKARFICQILLVGFGIAVFRKFCRKAKLEEFVGELALGILLGPTVLGLISPDWQTWLFPAETGERAAFELLAEFGVLLLLLRSGLEIKPDHVKENKRAALVLAFGGIAIPLMLALVGTLVLYHFTGYRAPGGQPLYVAALYVAATIAVSSMSIALRVLASTRLQLHPTGKVIVCAYAVDGVIGWLMFGVIFQFAGGDLSFTPVLFRLGAALFLTLVTVTIGPKLVDRFLSRVKNGKRNEPVYAAATAAILGLGLVTHALGVTMYFGVFLAGVLFANSHVLTSDMRRRLVSIPYHLLGPLYFVGLGLFADFRSEFSPVMVIYITVASILFKYIGTYVSGRPAGRPRHEWHTLAVSFTPSGADALIFAGLALQIGLITEGVLSGIIAAAVVSSVLCGPWLRKALKALPPVPVRLWDYIYQPGGRLLPRCDGDTHGAVMLNILERLTAAINGSGANISTDELALLVEQAGLRPGSSKQVQGMPEGMALLHSSIPELDEPKIVFFWAGEPVQWTQNAKVRLVAALMVPEGVRDLRIYSRLAKAILRLGESDEFKSASGPSEAVRKAVAVKLGEIIHCLEDEAKGASR